MRLQIWLRGPCPSCALCTWGWERAAMSVRSAAQKATLDGWGVWVWTADTLQHGLPQDRTRRWICGRRTDRFETKYPSKSTDMCNVPRPKLRDFLDESIPPADQTLYTSPLDYMVKVIDQRLNEIIEKHIHELNNESVLVFNTKCAGVDEMEV